jgi:cobalamin biosynthesis Mg chelatase CobN
MITFIIATAIFVGVVFWVLHVQRRNQKRMEETSRRFDSKMANVIPLVQKQHTMQFGRASTALESSFPSAIVPPKTKKTHA